MRLNKYIVESEDRILRYGPLVWRELMKNCKPFLKEFKRTGIKGKKSNIAGNPAKFWIWRGASKGISSTPGWKEIKPRGNRYPKDMPEGLHHKLDSEFSNKFGWNARSEGVFTTSSRRTAASYGKPYIFFPVGHYEYLWSEEVDDLYTWADSTADVLSYGDEDYNDWSGGNEDLYQEEWGENTYNGVWKYDGEEICDYRCSRQDAEAEAIDSFGEDDYDWSRLEWVPEVDFDEWLYRKNEEDRDRMDNEIDGIINSYQDKDLKGAIKSAHEIMFNCKSYYLVHESYSDFLQSMISIGSYQYKLPFPHDYLELSKFGKPKFWVKTKGGDLIHSG